MRYLGAAGAAFAVMCMLLGGCASRRPAFDEKPTMSRTTLTIADSGTTLSLHVGDTLVVKLDEAPGAGYRWTAGETTSTLLQPVDSSYEAPRSALGGTGMRVMTYEARATGNTRLVLRNTRAWQSDGPAAGSFELEVHITR